MGFVIIDAMKAIKKATNILKKMQAIGPPRWWWKVTQPWKIDQILHLQTKLSAERGSLSEHTASLQAAISVASYTVSLEQLEGVLDGTTIFTHVDMKKMWKKRIGADKTKVPLDEFSGKIKRKLMLLFSPSY